VARKALGKQIRVQVLVRDKYKCKMCGRTKDEVPLEVDHIIPVSGGGTDELSNLATLCRDCNRGKAAYHFEDYNTIRVIPDNMEKHYKFIQDDKIGDFEQFHLYLYYKEGIHSGNIDGKFHHKWRISYSQYSSSSNPQAFESRRRKEETRAFTQKIKEQLISEGKRIEINEEGICII
jgi:hypothetical protein